MKQVAKLSLVAGAAAEVAFHEKFDSLDNWKMSSWKPESEMNPFELKSLKWSADAKTLATTQDARFYAASSVFKKPVSFKGKSLLVQYEVTYEPNPECGGGYIKLGESMENEQDKFGGDDAKYPYYIMFGPDQCGYTKRTHLIFSYKGKNVLKKVDLPYKQAEDGLTSIYRLVVTPEGKITVRINDEEAYTGELEKDWELLPAKEIDDPEDKKPSDWVDDAMMDDPEDKKPADYVEEKEVVDKEAKKPDDWDADEDGEWEAPMIANPDYKGEWKAKRISNPAYKGVWAPKKIANPEYTADDNLYLLGKEDPKLGWVGLDLWQVKAGSRFDNMVVSVDADEKALVKEADDAVDDWKKLRDDQKKEQEKEKEAKKAEDDKKAEEEKNKPKEEEEVDNDDDGKDGEDEKKGDDKKDDDDL